MEKPHFASITTKEFVENLRSHNIEPTQEELNSAPLSNFVPLESGITLSILEITGQRFGEAPGSTPAK